MKSTNYIKNQLNRLIEEFPQLKISYEFDEIDNSHIIEVLPSKEYNENIHYSKSETEIIIDFISKYPYEEIVFITENSLIKISKPFYEIIGYYYDNSNGISIVEVNNIEATCNEMIYITESQNEYLIAA
jgi:hypothetical protein